MDPAERTITFPHIGGRYRVLLFIVIAGVTIIGLIAGARTHSDTLAKRGVAEWRNRLTASLGPTQEFLSAWVEDRFADAREAARMIVTPSIVHRHITPSGISSETALDDSLIHSVAIRMRRSGFREVWVIDTSGTVVTSDGGTTPLPSEIAAARTTARTFTELVSGPTVDSTGRARVAVITPIPRRRLALVIAYDAAQTLFPLVEREGGAERTIRTKIIAVDPAGFHILSPSVYPGSEALGRVVARQAAPVPWQRAVAGVETTGTFIDLDGRPIIAATTFVGGAKWGLVRAIDEREALSAARADFRTECWIALLLLSVCVMVCVAVYRDVRKRERVELLQRRARANEEETRRIMEMRDEMERQVTSRTAALRTALEAAELANHAKSEFLARMSHELRTPLNSVIGFANILTKNKAGNLRPQDVSYVERIGANGKHLLSLINSILDLAKIESGKMEQELTDVHLGTLVTEVTAELEGVLRDRPVILVADVPTPMATIRSDATKLRQILVNLIGNAAKFTERGTITVRIATDPHTARPSRIEVSDTGIGIPTDRLLTIFKPFEQADNSMTRRYGGTGLGLAITWSLCELLYARLTVESAVGLGSIFTVHLDDTLERVTDASMSPEIEHMTKTGSWALAPTAATNALPARPRERVVLMIDDDDDSRAVLRQYVEGEGYQVVEASSGMEGIHLAATLAPDLITLDLMMPDMNGWDVLHQLKGDRRLQHIPVVIVSIIAQESRGHVFGVVDLLDKPCTQEALQATLRRNLSSTTTRILLVEDNVDAQSVMLHYLHDWPDIDVRTADNGVTALQILGEFIPDLILLDLMMPGMDGVTFLKHLRNDSRYAQIRVVVVTAQELSGAERSALDAQTLAVIEKGETLEGQLEQIFNGIGLRLATTDPYGQR